LRLGVARFFAEVIGIAAKVVDRCEGCLDAITLDPRPW
jgi:hypothetical protein